MADKLANTVSSLLEVLREKSVLIAAIVGESSSELEKTSMACFEVCLVLVYLGKLELFILNPAFHYLRCTIR